MKLRMERLHVQADARGIPQRVFWHGQWHQVEQVLDEWRYAGKWWVDGLGCQRLYFRLRATTPQRREITLEIYRQGREWVLSRQDD